MFPDVAVNYFSHSQLRECAILAPNNIVKNINGDILALLPAEVTEYISINTVVDPNDCVNCPTEFMISLEPASQTSTTSWHPSHSAVQPGCSKAL